MQAVTIIRRVNSLGWKKGDLAEFFIRCAPKNGLVGLVYYRVCRGGACGHQSDVDEIYSGRINFLSTEG
jgi:hypothetical protein